MTTKPDRAFLPLGDDFPEPHMGPGPVQMIEPAEPGLPPLPPPDMSHERARDDRDEDLSYSPEAAKEIQTRAYAAGLAAGLANKPAAPGVVDEVLRELERATAKFPTWPTDPLHALAVLGEEFGELTKAMLQFTYEPHKKVTRMEIRAEAIQTAAMALRLAMSLPMYDYAPGPQHSQGIR